MQYISVKERRNAPLIWLQANGTTQNWFMHINYWDVHHPYAAPQKFFDGVRTVAYAGASDAEAIARDANDYYGPRTSRVWWIEGYVVAVIASRSCGLIEF